LVEKRIFSTYKKVDGENLYIENSSTSNVLGDRKVILKTISRKLFTLNNELHVANIKKNLAFNSLFSKNSFNMVYESNKFILSKSGMFLEMSVSIMTFLR
jgi:hypothetical protein